MAQRKGSRARPLPTLPFKDFLTFDRMQRFLESLTQARPELCRLEAIGHSRDHRPIFMLTVTDFASGPPEDKPAYLIHGNIHATELAGTHNALATARALLVDHQRRRHDLLERVAFHIVPRLNPDGAEFAVQTGGVIRSRTERQPLQPNTLYQEDVDGDGLVLTMRQKHPNGPFAKDPSDPRLMIERKADSKPPFYRLMPEGLIYEWDGSEAIRIEGRQYDWNRNWSYDWRPEPEQGGAGDYPFSEPEMQALARWIHDTPNLFAILGYHTGPNAFLMPPSTGSLDDIDADDLRVIQDIGEIGAEQTGFPAIHVIHYKRERDRDINLRGHFHNFGYRHLGLFVFEFEQGTIENSPGITTEEVFGCRTTEDHEALVRRIMRWWKRNRAKSPKLFKAWRRFEHPQLGTVEIGGFLRKDYYNPTLPELAKIAKDCYAFTIEHAAKHPWVRIEDVATEQVAERVYRVRARIVNRGELPTHVTNRGKELSRLKTVRVEFRVGEEAELLSQQAHHDLGHLPGVVGGKLMEWFVRTPPEGALCTLDARGGAGGNASASVELTPGDRPG